MSPILFEQFIRDKVYLEDIKQTTVESYRTAYKAFQRVLGKTDDRESSFDHNGLPTKDTLKDLLSECGRVGYRMGVVMCISVR
jgi:hypothetical protein